MTEPEWLARNRANWNERVPLHLASQAMYDQTALRLDMFLKHDSVRWPMFDCLVPTGNGGYRWPDQPWLPLSYSLRASKPA